MATAHRLDFEQTLAGRRVLVTGHTGFTGSWACLWLRAIGAEVTGLALPPETEPALFRELGLETAVPTVYADIRDADAVAACVERVRPELVLHLAAQPLVRRSYREPVATFATNAIGTAHVLEAARQAPGVRAVVCITTDKVYRNNEWPWPYRENDPLGGKDPYSASKAAAEMVVESYRASFGERAGTPIGIASARGGNIVGGGDWSEDRLVPDFVRAVISGETLVLRYPDALRPWQHVLALVQGYLMLTAALLDDPARYSRSWNFGPHDPRAYSVRDVVELLAEGWTRPPLEYMDQPAPEARALALDSTLAHNALGWSGVWDTRQVITETARWYREFYRDRSGVQALCADQLGAWREALRQDKA